jgi:prepilin-type N-terminal cleavage/methylation domain-containing protein
MKYFFNFKSKRGFTLIELMVVIGIISILSAVVLGFVNGARESGRMSASIQFDTNVKHTIGDQLVGEWNFDESSGNTVLDTSSYGNNGTISGSSYSRVNGVFGNALGLVAGNSLVSIPSSPILNLYRNSFTASIWVKTNSAGDMKIFKIGNGSNAELNYYHNYLRNCFNNCEGTLKTFVADNIWHNVAVIGDDKSIRLYFDGKLMPDNTLPASTLIMSGGVTVGLSTSFQGYVDEFRLYSTPLEVAQIQQLYAEGLKSHQDLALSK